MPPIPTTTPLPPLDVLRAHLTPTDREGSLRILHLDATGAVLHITPVAEGAHSADQLFARYLAGLVTDVGSAAAVLLVNRRQGRPRRTDRALWDAVNSRLQTGPTQLLELVVLAG